MSLRFPQRRIEHSCLPGHFSDGWSVPWGFTRWTKEHKHLEVFSAVGSIHRGLLGGLLTHSKRIESHTVHTYAGINRLTYKKNWRDLFKDPTFMLSSTYNHDAICEKTLVQSALFWLFLGVLEFKRCVTERRA